MSTNKFMHLDDDCLRCIGDWCADPWRGLTAANRRLWTLLGLRRVPQLGSLDEARVRGLAGRVVQLGLRLGATAPPNARVLHRLGPQLRELALAGAWTVAADEGLHVHDLDHLRRLTLEVACRVPISGLPGYLETLEIKSTVDPVLLPTLVHPSASLLRRGLCHDGLRRLHLPCWIVLPTTAQSTLEDVTIGGDGRTVTTAATVGDGLAALTVCPRLRRLDATIAESDAPDPERPVLLFPALEYLTLRTWGDDPPSTDIRVHSLQEIQRWPTARLQSVVPIRRYRLEIKSDVGRLSPPRTPGATSCCAL